MDGILRGAVAEEQVSYRLAEQPAVLHHTIMPESVLSGVRFGRVTVQIAGQDPPAMLVAAGTFGFSAGFTRGPNPNRASSTTGNSMASIAFNSPTFGSPNTSVTSSSFGRITSQANTPRQIQLDLKFLW